MNKIEIDKLREYYQEKLGELFDEFDFEYEIDRDINYDEAKRELDEKINELFPEINMTNKEMKEEIKKNEQMEKSYVSKVADEHKANLLSLFSKPNIIGIVGDANSGKSLMIYHIIKELKKVGTFKLYSYGLRVDVGEQKIYSIEELEKIRNSIIFVDEYFSLIDIDDRRNRKSIEQTLRLLFHNNNVLVLVGLPENFKKFISSKLTAVIFKQSTLSDYINGSRIKNLCLNYRGVELGSAMLNIHQNEALVYDGEHYNKIEVPYYVEYDTKLKNVPILVPKIVEKENKK